MQTGFKWVNLKDRDHLEFLGLRCRILLEQILIKCDEMAWIRFIYEACPECKDTSCVGR